jgi:hypothetical protein
VSFSGSRFANLDAHARVVGEEGLQFRPWRFLWLVAEAVSQNRFLLLLPMNATAEPELVRIINGATNDSK